VFWLVNLYSLFVNIEHNGDESTKGNTVLYLLKCEVSKHMYFVCYKVVTNLCYMSSTLLSSKHENLLLQLHNFLSFLDWYSNNANFIMLLLQTFNWINQCCWSWSGRPAGWLIQMKVRWCCYFTWELMHKENKHEMWVSRGLEARTCNDFCSRKAISIAYSEIVFVTLGIQRTMRMCHIVICCLSGCSILVHIMS